MHESDLSIAAAQVHEWLICLNRTAQGIRFYPVHSDIREQLLDVLFASLTNMLSGCKDVHLRVRDGAIDLGEETVLEDRDDKSFGNILFANSILEVVFNEGVSRRELKAFVETVLVDYRRAAADGEELATALWRLDLPHIQYKQVDLLTIAILGNELEPHQRVEVDDDHFRQLKRAIDTITGTLAVDKGTGTDVVAMIDGAIETPRDRSVAADLAKRWFDDIAASARQQMDPRAFSELALELRTKNTHEEIVVHLISLLFDALRREERPYDPSAALELLLIVFDGIIEAGQFDDAARIVRRLTNFARRAQSASQVEFAHRFLVRFGRAEHVRSAVDTLVEADQRDRAKVLAYLDALERYAVPWLLDQIDRVEHHEPRYELCELLVRYGDKRIDLLVARLPKMRHEVASAILESAKVMPTNAGSEVVWAGLLHSHPQVRAAAVQALARFNGPAAHRAIVQALDDENTLVVSTAIRVIQARNITKARLPLSRMIETERLLDTEPRLVGLLLDTYARMEHVDAIPRLERLARTPGLLSPKRATTVAVAAARALGTIADEGSIEALIRIGRSLNAKVRRTARDAITEVKAKLANPISATTPGRTPRPILEPNRKREIELVPLDKDATPPELPPEFLTPMPQVAAVMPPVRTAPLRLPSDALRPLTPVETPPSRAVLRFEVVVGEGGDN